MDTTTLLDSQPFTCDAPSDGGLRFGTEPVRVSLSSPAPFPDAPARSPTAADEMRAPLPHAETT
jgi:hypothetical protein